MHQIDYASKTLLRSSERCNVGPKIVWCIFRVHVKTGFFNFPQATVQPQVTYTVIILNLAFSCDYLVQYLFSSTPFFRLQCYCSFFVLYSLHHYPHVISDCCLRFKTSVPFSQSHGSKMTIAKVRQIPTVLSECCRTFSNQIFKQNCTVQFDHIDTNITILSGIL